MGPWTDLQALGRLALAWTGELSVPAGFRPWLERLLASDPGDRFRCAADAAWGLVRIPDPGGGGAIFLAAVDVDAHLAGERPRTLSWSHEAVAGGDEHPPFTGWRKAGEPPGSDPDRRDAPWAALAKARAAGTPALLDLPGGTEARALGRWLCVRCQELGLGTPELEQLQDRVVVRWAP